MIRNLITMGLPIYFYVILITYCLISHCIFAIVFQKVAEAEKFKRPYYAWIPFLNLYLVVKMGATNKWLLLAAIGLVIPELWIFFLVAFLMIVANFVADTLKRYGVGSLLVYCGIVIPFLWVIPLLELYSKAKFNIMNNYSFDNNGKIVKDI